MVFVRRGPLFLSEVAPILALIYNESLGQGTVPDDWRQANVAPVFKKERNMMQ